MIIRTLAVIAGLAAILAPLVRMIQLSKRSRGLTIGSGSSWRRWPFALATAGGLAAVGALLWKPLPLRFSPVIENILLGAGSLAYFPAIVLYLWSLAALGREFGVSNSTGADLYADHHLVRTGPYRWIRHPMYLGVLMAAAGSLLIFRTWAALFFAPLSLVVLRRASHEEALLSQEFSDEWQEYSGQVPKWLPGCYKEH